MILYARFSDSYGGEPARYRAGTSRGRGCDRSRGCGIEPPDRRSDEPVVVITTEARIDRRSVISDPGGVLRHCGQRATGG